MKHEREIIPVDYTIEPDNQRFNLVMDVIERAWQHWPVDSWKDNAERHTSAYAAAAARRIFWIIAGLYDEVEPYDPPPPEQEGRGPEVDRTEIEATDAETVPCQNN